MLKAIFEYIPVVPAIIGLLVFCLVPFEDPKACKPERPEIETVCANGGR